MIRWMLAFSAVCGLVYGHTELDIIVGDFWQWRMRNNPEFASNVGDHSYTSEVEDYSISAIAPRKTAMDNFVRRIEKVDRNALRAGDRVTYDVLLDTIQTWLDGYEWKDYGPMNPINIMEGIHGSLGSKVGQVKFENESNYSDFATRIGKFAVQITQIIERMKRAIEMKTTYNIASIAGVPESIQADLDKYMNNPKDLPLYEPFKDNLDTDVTNVTAKIAIRAQALANVQTLLQNLKILKEFLEEEYIPNTRSSFGVGGLHRGGEYYAACLKWQLSVDLTAGEIHDLGIQEVNRVHGELEKIVRKAGFDGTVKEYNDYLRNNKELFIEDGDQALQMFKDIYDKRIVPELDKWFKNIPSSTLKIEKMPNNGPNGLYKNGSPDGKRPGVFYANVHSPIPTFDLPALLVHETDPGHHLQDSYALTAAGIPVFRRATDFSKYFAVPLHFPFYTAYSEGWGLYSEDFGETMGVYENDIERFGKFGLEIFRAARLVVDTGIHAKNWTQQHAIDYMFNNTAYKLDFITREINRYATWPAQATSYTIGKLKILELKKYAAMKLCGLFRIKDFHHVLLTNGAMPLSVMENLVKEWVEQVRQDNNITGDDCTDTWSNGAGTLYGTSWILALTFYLVSFLF